MRLRVWERRKDDNDRERLSGRVMWSQTSDSWNKKKMIIFTNGNCPMPQYWCSIFFAAGAVQTSSQQHLHSRIIAIAPISETAPKVARKFVDGEAIRSVSKLFIVLFRKALARNS